MSGASSPHSRTGAFTVTVSGDLRFIETIRSLTHRAAEADGCAGADASRLAAAVERVLTTCLGGGPSLPPGGAMDVWFQPSAEAFFVEIRVPVHAVAGRDGSLERSLAAHGDLDAVRRLVPGTEFGATGAHHFCRMSCHHAGSS